MTPLASFRPLAPPGHEALPPTGTIAVGADGVTALVLLDSGSVLVEVGETRLVLVGVPGVATLPIHDSAETPRRSKKGGTQ